MANENIAKHLELIAQLKQLSGASAFSYGAYQKAATTIREINKEIKNKSDLKGVAGIGAKTQKAIQQFIDTGTSDSYESLATQFPVECLSMATVQGIGAKRALKIYEHEFAKNFDDLVKLAENDDLQKLEDAKIGVNAKNLKDAIIFAKETKMGRVPYIQAYLVAQNIQKVIEPFVDTMELAGSLRRKKDTIKDIDILIREEKEKFKETLDCCLAALEGDDIEVEIVTRGDVKASLRVKVNYSPKMRVDLWMVEPYCWGSYLNYATGSKEHNVILREKAKEMGLLVNEKGIFKVDTGERIGGENEHDLYNILGIDYVEPTER